MTFLQQMAGEESAMMERNLQRHAEAYAIPYGAVSANQVSVMGNGHMMFIGNGANAWEKQLLGRLAMPGDWAHRWHQVLTLRRQIAEKTGLRLVHLVMPEKQVVIPDLRWPNGAELDFARRPFMQIPWEAAGPSVPVYPDRSFAAARDWSPVYWLGNSHCLASGSLIAARLALDAFGIDEPLDESNTATTTRTIAHDLMTHFLATPPEEEVLRIRRPGETVYERDMREVNGSFTGSQYVLRNASAKVDARLAIFGDSYCWDVGIGDIMAGVFREVHFVWTKDILWDYVGKHAISHVLWESAERFLIKPPQR